MIPNNRGDRAQMTLQWPRANIARSVHTADVQEVEHLPQQALLLGKAHQGTGRQPSKQVHCVYCEYKMTLKQ